ncbi:unnamed protein product [Closterium sp. NIES-53]
MKRREVSFEVGDQVFFSTKNIRLKILGARKLFPRWIGPFEVIKRVGVVAYKLRLPDTLQIHHVFHVSLLNKYIGEGKDLPPPTIVLGEELFYEVERALMHRDRQRGRKTVREFLIKWKGYGLEHNSWEPEEHLTEIAVQSHMADLARRAAAQPADGVDPGCNVTRRAQSARPQKHPKATGTLPPRGGGV